ncbi:hypothetical protein [Oribacterium sp. WCC10]|uniref:hypothetical protein n=1 Tax=Oribacterium sp. WCC10 TaxID=1855343 RepID=UPI0008E89F0D|nr:hypothetical protein [Oribacterium sp. WCC10]SFG47769.1 hypothetical protein SAMN05216356_11019 [Oribacterium sp. WCC10]
MKKEKELMKAIGDIDEKYVAEAAPEKVIRMAAGRRWKPYYAVAAAVVIIIGFGAYLAVNNQGSTQMAPEMVKEEASEGEQDIMLQKEAPEGAQYSMSENAGVTSDLPGSGNDDGTAKSGMKKALPDATAPDTEARLYIGSEETAGNSDVDADARSNAASPEAGTDSRVMTANPWKDSDTLKEAEADAGFEVNIPDRFKDFAPSCYRSIKNDIIEIIYTDSEGNEAFRIRKSAGTDDISGDYNSYESEKSTSVEDKTVNIKSNGNDVYVVTWCEGNYTYAIDIDETQHFTEEDMLELVKAVS